MVQAVAGITYHAAREWAKERRPLPRHAAIVLRDYLASHAAQSLALVRELEDYIKVKEQNNPRGVGFRKVMVRDETGIPRDGRVRKLP